MDPKCMSTHRWSDRERERERESARYANYERAHSTILLRFTVLCVYFCRKNEGEDEGMAKKTQRPYL